jgi:hypothetical protein
MLTIFTIPKPFREDAVILQQNAIRSWSQICPTCEIILCGNDPGVADTASAYGIGHIPDVACNEYGTPFLSSAFEQVLGVAKNRLLCYVNADIIFLSDLISSVRRVTFAQFLMVGQRWNLHITEPIPFEEQDWERELREAALAKAALSPPGAIDYFVFPRSTVPELPDFVVGRPGWDNWFIYQFRASGVPVIDVTKTNMVIHQNHGYGHVSQRRKGTRWEGPEADHNLRLMGSEELAYTVLDSTHMLTDRALLPAVEYKYLRRRAVRLLYSSRTLFKVARRLARFTNSLMARQRA